MKSGSLNNKEQERQPMSKKIAMIVFVGMFVIFMLVVIAIMNSGSNETRSAAPQVSFEPSARSAHDLEIMAKRQEVPTMPAIEIEAVEIEPLIVSVPQPQMFIEEQRQTQHGLRTLAANSTTALGNFPSSQSQQNASDINKVGSSNGYALLEDQIAAEKQNEAMFLASKTTEYPATGSPQNKDPNGWESKDSFVAGNKGLEGYSQHFRQPQRAVLEIKSGTIIPCVLITGINSDLPGNCLGQVTEDVYDSATGKNMLIPKGSKVIGTYDNRIAYGQSRVLAVWSKLIYPDGSTLMLENLSAADQAGYTGYKGEINRHWNTLIGSALVVSLLGAGVDIATPSNRSNSDDDAGSILAENATRAVAEAMSKVIEREAERAPTIKIQPGKRFMLFVKQDVAFPSKWK